jgi:hypothetical protein
MSGTGFGALYCSGGDCTLYAGLFLPAGALVSSIELEACDADAGGGVGAILYRTGKLETSLTALATTATGGSPGCITATGTLASAHTIDNVNNTYFVQVDITGGTLATRLHAVRVLYNLQVSPAPATSTFGDVPTSHPFFQFVEALVASGITAGCGGGNYCPDAPLTRGQMAVFLSKALGLHFP